MMDEARQRVLWLAVRRGLLLIVAAIETYCELDRAPRECARLSPKGRNPLSE
jgi:hypothetical protein